MKPKMSTSTKPAVIRIETKVGPGSGTPRTTITNNASIGKRNLDNAVGKPQSNPSLTIVYCGISVVLQTLTMLALVGQVILFYQELRWMKVLRGERPLRYSEVNPAWSDKFILFDISGPDGNEMWELWCRKKFGLVFLTNLAVLFFLFVFNLYSWNSKVNQCRVVQIYALFTIAVLFLGVIQLGLPNQYYRLNGNRVYDYDYFKKVIKFLGAGVPARDAVDVSGTGSLIRSDTLSVKDNKEYFHRVYTTCHNGYTGVAGIDYEFINGQKQFLPVPNYIQLMKMGFCVDEITLGITAQLMILALVPALASQIAMRCIMVVFDMAEETLKKMKNSISNV